MAFLRLGFRPHVPSDFFQKLDFLSQKREMDGIFVSASSDLRKPNVISESSDYLAEILENLVLCVVNQRKRPKFKWFP